MTYTAHFGESSAQRPSLSVDVPLHGLAPYSGLLGNLRAQTPTARRTDEFEEAELWLWTTLNKRFGAATPASRLAILKRRQFTPEGREHRIRLALAALDAAQPTNLTAEEWKTVVEEVEEDEE